MIQGGSIHIVHHQIVLVGVHPHFVNGHYIGMAETGGGGRFCAKPLNRTRTRQ